MRAWKARVHSRQPSTWPLSFQPPSYGACTSRDPSISLRQGTGQGTYWTEEGQEDPLTSRQMGDSGREPRVRRGAGRAEVVTPANQLLMAAFVVGEWS